MSTGEVFYRHWGGANDRPPVLLLHPSPLSSAFVEPLGYYLADTFEVYALDIPGYGLSEPLKPQPRRMADYVPFLLHFMRKKRLDRVYLYGTATGCQLVIAFALAFPERVERLVGENACHFEAAERDDLLAAYFPDVKPQPDGGHLLRIWEMCYKTCIGFPWTRVPNNSLLPEGVSIERVQAMVRDTLLAGEQYHVAYRAAFEHERAEHVQALRVPAVFVLWQHSVVLPYAERLASFPMPPNVRFVRCAGGIDERYRTIKQALCAS